jgi:small-conductance mechanosensitive channel
MLPPPVALASRVLALPLAAAPLGERLRPGPLLELEPWKWLALGAGLLAALGLALLLERLVLALALRLTGLTRLTWDDAVVAAGRGPLKVFFLAVLVFVSARLLTLPPLVMRGLYLVARSLVIVWVAWFLLRFLHMSAEYLEERVTQEGELDLPGRTRKLHTQLTVLRQVAEVGVYVLAVALLLMQFTVVRNVGVSLLASAGIAGLALGFAAQRSLATLLAGIQLSITQPVRIGDYVVTSAQGEGGKVEEITLTYLVVRLGDDRRLVVPINRFLEEPFENWSKGGGELTGGVNLHVDFGTDIEALRRELSRILAHEARALWDGRLQGLTVTEMLDRSLTVRAQMSAADPESYFRLRNLVREQLVRYLQRYPQWLPLTRMESRALPAPEARRHDA